jgi:integrase
MPSGGGEYRIGRLHGGYAVSWWTGEGAERKRRRFRLSARTKPEAEAEAIDVIRRQVGTEKANGPTIEDLWEAYRKEKVGRRVAVAMGHEWKALGPVLGHLRPDQLTVDTCRRYRDLRRAAGKHDGTIWTELGHLRTVMVWALGRDKAPKVERPPKPAPKERYLTHEEIARLLAVPTAPHIRNAILIMLATGARVGAVLELTWDRVSFDENQINFRTTDTGPRKGRAIVGMNAGLRAALAVAKEAALTDYVIEWAGKPVKNIKTGFYKAVRDAGLKSVSPHTLRHTAGVHLAAAGRPMHKISQYLGHSNTSVTERVYARFQPDHMREEADVLDFTKIRKATG